MPGDLHKLWRTRQPNGYHMEYGYSCMGYEIAGGLGAKMAYPDREVYVLVGDGIYLMMPTEIVTAYRKTASSTSSCSTIMALPASAGSARCCGNAGSAPVSVRRHGKYEGDICRLTSWPTPQPGSMDNRARTGEELKAALQCARQQKRTSVVVVETAYDQRVPGYESWWDVPIAEVSERETVKVARKTTKKRARRNVTSSRNGKRKALGLLAANSRGFRLGNAGRVLSTRYELSKSAGLSDP